MPIPAESFRRVRAQAAELKTRIKELNQKINELKQVRSGKRPSGSVEHSGKRARQ